MDSSFREVMESLGKFIVPIGITSKGQLLTEDIREFPHLLVCGATGTGKSSFLHSLISSLITHCTPAELRLLLCDTKVVEFSVYNGIPHLLSPVVSCSDKIAGALAWAATECNRRLRLFGESGVRSLGAFNDSAWQEFSDEFARIVIVVDDFASVVAANPEAANAMLTILQNGRIAGVHLIAATQTPTLKQIKRISLAMRSKILFSTSPDDIRILAGARKTIIPLVPGDALAAVAGKPLIKLHTVVPSDVEIDELISNIKKESVSDYFEDIMEHIEKCANEPQNSASDNSYVSSEPSDGDELLPAAVEIVLETGQASVSTLQRRLKLGYARAARIVDEMEDRGIVGPFEGAKPRPVLISRAQWEQMQNGTYMPGNSQPKDVTICPRCNQICKDGYNFCTHCGARLL